MRYQQHPLSAAFPAMPESEINDLAESIKKKGLKHPIALYQGMVLDGWHRYLACEIAGVSPRFYDYNGSDPVGEARALNLHRRHILNAGQRALIEVRLSEWAPTGKPAKGATIAPLATVAEMAEKADTGTRVVQQAKRVEEGGTSEVKAAALSGEIQIAKAAAVAKKPKREQAKALKEAKEKKPKLPKKPSAAKPAGDVEKRLAKLQADYDELKENRDELADELKTCLAISEGKEAKVMNALREELRICTRRKNELMANLSEAKKSATYWMGQAKKLGWKPKK